VGEYVLHLYLGLVKGRKGNRKMSFYYKYYHKAFTNTIILGLDTE